MFLNKKLSIKRCEYFQGVSVQNYVLEPETQSTFTDVYICADEISRHLSNHENWVTPILPQIPGCPRLIFNPEAFKEASQNWICVSGWQSMGHISVNNYGDSIDSGFYGRNQMHTMIYIKVYHFMYVYIYIYQKYIEYIHIFYCPKWLYNTASFKNVKI